MSTHTPEPLRAGDLLEIAMNGSIFPVDRVLATYADPNNWAQIYNGEGPSYYAAKPCEWAFIGPVRPGYELAQHALERGHDPASVVVVDKAVMEESKEALRRASIFCPHDGMAKAMANEALASYDSAKAGNVGGQNAERTGGTSGAVTGSAI